MSNNSVIAGSVVIAVLLWAQGGSTQNRPSAPAIPAAPTNAAAPAVAEQADQLLKEMSAYIGSANEFTFHADITFDHVLPSGQKLQFSAAEEVVLKRPGGLYIEWNGDLGARQFWYDGKSVTLYDPATPFYAGEAAPPEVDKMLEQLVPKNWTLHRRSSTFSIAILTKACAAISSTASISVRTTRTAGRAALWPLSRRISIRRSGLRTGRSPRPARWSSSTRLSRRSLNLPRYSAIGTLRRGSPKRCSHLNCHPARRKSRSQQSQPPSSTGRMSMTRRVHRTGCLGETARSAADAGGLWS